MKHVYKKLAKVMRRTADTVQNISVRVVNVAHDVDNHVNEVVVHKLHSGANHLDKKARKMRKKSK